MEITNARIEVDATSFQPLVRCTVTLSMEEMQDIKAQHGEDELCRIIGAMVLAGVKDAPRISVVNMGD
jgi:hypothetical protein